MDTMMIGADYGKGMMITFQESEIATKTLIYNYIYYICIYLYMYVYLYTYYYILLQQNISQHDSMLNSRILRNATAQADQTATPGKRLTIVYKSHGSIVAVLLVVVLLVKLKVLVVT